MLEMMQNLLSQLHKPILGGVFMLRELSQNIKEIKKKERKKERNVVCAEMRLLHWPSQLFTL